MGLLGSRREKATKNGSVLWSASCRRTPKAFMPRRSVRARIARTPGPRTLGDMPACRFAHVSPEVFVEKQALRLAAKRDLVSRRNHQADAGIGNQLTHPRLIRGDDGSPGRHGFEHDLRAVSRLTGRPANVGRGQQSPAHPRAGRETPRSPRGGFVARTIASRAAGDRRRSGAGGGRETHSAACRRPRWRPESRASFHARPRT